MIFLLPINMFFIKASAVCGSETFEDYYFLNCSFLFIKPLSFGSQKHSNILRWHHGNEDPFTFAVHIEDVKKFHPIQKRKRNWWNWNPVCRKATKQEGRLEKMNQGTERGKKELRHWGTQVSLTLMAKVLLNWIVLEVNYLLREWQRIAISVQRTLEEEWNPCCMLILFGVLAKYTPNGLILRYQKKKWGFNSPWFSVCHTRWRGWDLLSSSLCLWHKVEPIAFQIFLGAWQSKPWG